MRETIEISDPNAQEQVTARLQDLATARAEILMLPLDPQNMNDVYSNYVSASFRPPDDVTIDFYQQLPPGKLEDGVLKVEAVHKVRVILSFPQAISLANVLAQAAPILNLAAANATSQTKGQGEAK